LFLVQHQWHIALRGETHICCSVGTGTSACGSRGTEIYTCIYEYSEKSISKTRGTETHNCSYRGKGKYKVIPLRDRCRQRVGRGIALLFHDRGTRRGLVVSSTPQPHFTPGKDAVPILQEAAWGPVPVWTDRKSRPNRNSIPDRPVRSSVAIRIELPGPQF